MSETSPEPASPRPTRRRSWLLWVGLLIALLATAAASVLYGYRWLLRTYANEPGPGEGELVSVTLAQGESLEVVAAHLGAAGALSRPRLWTLYAQARGAQPKLRQGEILLYDDMTPRQLLQRVARGFGAAEMRVMLPEGSTRFDIAQRLERFGLCSRDAFLSQTNDPSLLAELGIVGDSAEGYLFPDTYRLHEGLGPRELVRRLVTTAQRRLSTLEQQHAARVQTLQAELGVSLPQLVTLASIVEKEAAVRDEQATIAGVFYNRLRDPAFRPKRLQADPTVSYGCLRDPALASCAGYDGRSITRRMLEGEDNPYNTYRREGLPPGPICNPGLSALEAVMAPQEHRYLYFVARGDGRHVFSETLEAHNQAVAQFRR